MSYFDGKMTDTTQFSISLMNQTGRAPPTSEKRILRHPQSFEVMVQEPHYRRGPHGGACSQTELSGSKKEERLQGRETLNASEETVCSPSALRPTSLEPAES